MRGRHALTRQNVRTLVSISSGTEPAKAIERRGATHENGEPVRRLSTGGRVCAHLGVFPDDKRSEVKPSLVARPVGRRPRVLQQAMSLWEQLRTLLSPRRGAAWTCCDVEANDAVPRPPNALPLARLIPVLTLRAVGAGLQAVRAGGQLRGASDRQPRERHRRARRRPAAQPGARAPLHRPRGRQHHLQGLPPALLSTLSASPRSRPGSVWLSACIRAPAPDALPRSKLASNDAAGGRMAWGMKRGGVLLVGTSLFGGC